MNTNIAIQNVATVAWDGTTARAADIRPFTLFAWSFEVTADITTDAVFIVESADPSVADDCVPDTFSNVQDIVLCQSPGNTSTAGDATITIPAGTVAGTILGGTIHCRPAAFVRLAADSGDTANVTAVIVRHGPTGERVFNDPRV